ncbi:MAG: ABC transporter permease [Chloroflexi bacterium]|nr:ABC transporter permease [Chloroflexota bacterium]
MTRPAAAVASPSPSRRVMNALYARPRSVASLLMAAPLTWLVVVYLGSLALLLVSAFWTYSAATDTIDTTPSLVNFGEIIASSTFRTIALRTMGMAALVTLTTAIIAFPIAYYMARVASHRVRGLLVVAILLPLWASYVVKVYAWRIILSEQGILNWSLEPLGVSGPGYGDVALWLVFTYLWLPYMILPIYAGLERIPTGLLEASSDLGARGRQTFRRIILPLAFPAVVAGSIFTFSLTLGDYIAPSLITSTQFLGNVIFSQLGAAGDLPLAAALGTIPVVLMIIYLLAARRLGAFEAL